MAPHLSLSAFYQNFKKYFSFKRCDKSLPHVIISKYSSHSICTQCVALNNSRRQCKTEAQLKQATELKNQHKTRSQVFTHIRWQSLKKFTKCTFSVKISHIWSLFVRRIICQWETMIKTIYFIHLGHFWGSNWANLANFACKM